jgi:hypothetical protein
MAAYFVVLQCPQVAFYSSPSDLVRARNPMLTLHLRRQAMEVEKDAVYIGGRL